ncbi:MAG: PadR family transcriptional regulator [Bacteroidaceae bacterium]|nr:PadR family transcriptional regulator [Bacteroidaceae bacterium]
MSVDNTKSQMRKGMLEYCIMLILHRQPSYANDIIVQLKEAKMIVVEGTLYPLLTRLKNDKLLKYDWQESTQGPPRKYYALTLDGEEALRQLDESWDELAFTVNVLRFPKEKLNESKGVKNENHGNSETYADTTLTETPDYHNI